MAEKKDLKWIYESESVDVLRERYDEWAGDYDEALESWGWIGPQATVEAFVQHLSSEARVLDVGAGTGLVGEALHKRGFRDLSALDLSSGMLAVARAKEVYKDFHTMELGKALDFPDGHFDGVIAVGVFTLGHAPASAFDELVRITKAGGPVAVLLRQDVYEENGFREQFERLTTEGRWTCIEVGEAVNTLPNEPSSTFHKVYVYRVS